MIPELSLISSPVHDMASEEPLVSNINWQLLINPPILHCIWHENGKLCQEARDRRDFANPPIFGCLSLLPLRPSPEAKGAYKLKTPLPPEPCRGCHVDVITHAPQGSSCSTRSRVVLCSGAALRRGLNSSLPLCPRQSSMTSLGGRRDLSRGDQHGTFTSAGSCSCSHRACAMSIAEGRWDESFLEN